MKADKGKWFFNSFCSNTLVTRVSDITETRMESTVYHTYPSLLRTALLGQTDGAFTFLLVDNFLLFLLCD